MSKLLGKVRDRDRIYDGEVRFPIMGYEPAHYAADVARMAASREGFTIVWQGIGFHSRMAREISGFVHGEPEAGPFHGSPTRGLLTERGFDHVVACV